MSIGPASLGDKPDSTMFAALHGELVFHPWWDAVASNSDAYSLFVARSSAMGWLDEATESASGGVWGMNDAGQEPGDGSQPSSVVWFQVSLSEPIPAGRPLPVQAFLRCAGDVAARIGTLRLQAVQVLLPLQASSSRDALGQLLQDVGWFADCDPHRRTPVRVVLDGGEDSSLLSTAPEMVSWLRQLNQDILSCDSFSVTDNADPVLEPTVIDETWLRPANHRVTFQCALAEWSLDSLGWLAALFADASSQHGVSAPFLMLTASPSERSSSHVD